MKMTMIGAAAALGVAGTASASTVDAVFNSGASDTAGFTTSEGNGGGGLFDYTVTGDGTANPWGLGDGDSTNIVSFCIELTQNATNGTGVEVLQGGGIAGNAPVPGSTTISTTGLKALSWLFNNHFNAAKQGGADAYAFQALVWEFVYEGVSGASDVDLAAGSFTASANNASLDGTITTTVNSWVAGAPADFSTYTINENLVVISGFGTDDPQFQDQITLIPLPAPVFMGLAGLGAAVVARRRMRQA